MPLSRSENRYMRDEQRQIRLLKRTYFHPRRSAAIQLRNTSEWSKVSPMPSSLNRTKGEKMAKPKKGPAFTADPFHACP